jgi:hypothetical protein
MRRCPPSNGLHSSASNLPGELNRSTRVYDQQAAWQVKKQ